LGKERGRKKTQTFRRTPHPVPYLKKQRQEGSAIWGYLKVGDTTKLLSEEEELAPSAVNRGPLNLGSLLRTGTKEEIVESKLKHRSTEHLKSARGKTGHPLKRLGWVGEPQTGRKSSFKFPFPFTQRGDSNSPPGTAKGGKGPKDENV